MLSTIIAETFSLPILFLWTVGVFTYIHSRILLKQQEQREEEEWQAIQRQLRFKIGLDATDTYREKKKDETQSKDNH